MSRSELADLLREMLEAIGIAAREQRSHYIAIGERIGELRAENERMRAALVRREKRGIVRREKRGRRERDGA